MLKKIFKTNNNIKGLQIKPSLNAASLDIEKIDFIEKLVYPLEDSKFNYYTPTVKTGDRVKKGQVIAVAENAHGLKILASAEGTIKGIETVKAPLPQKLADALVIEPINKTYTFEDAIFNNDVVLSEFPKELIFQSIVQANIQGLGGGLFLAAKKLLSSDKIDHIVLNAVECEPILNCDEALLTHYLAECLAGGLFLQKAANAKTITIVLKENKTDLISHIKHFVKNNEQFNNIAVATVPDLYPAGAEKEILKHVFNKPLKAKDISTNHGYLMNNIMTAVSIFRAVAIQTPQLERVFSVFGKNIENPKNILAPIGTTAEDLLRFAQIDESEIDSIRVGGLMMGEDITTETNIKTTALLKSSNGVILNTKEDKKTVECINCGECSKVCPVNLVPNKMFKTGQADDFANRFFKNLDECMFCNLCNYVCPSYIDLVGMFKYSRQQIQLIEQEKQRADYINKLTAKKRDREEAEKLEKERIKLERKLAREKRLAKKAKKEAVENAES
jgi:electron transport complex protein RnfC